MEHGPLINGLPIENLVGGISTPLKNHGVQVSWDDEIPNIWWKVIKFMFQTTNQLWLLQNHPF